MGALRLPTHFPLRAHLLLLVTGTLLPALLLAGFLLRNAIEEARRATERRLLETARAQASVVDFEIADTIHALEALARSPALDNGDLEAFFQEAQGVHGTQAAWFTVALMAPDGHQLVNTVRGWGTPLPDQAADPDSLAEVVQLRKPVTGNLREGRIDGQLAFPVRVPVIRNDQLRYVLTAIITPDRLTDLLRRQRASSEEWARTIVDRKGIVVTRTRDPGRFVGARITEQFRERRLRATEGVYQDVALDGELVYAAFAQAPLSGWTATVAVPVGTVEGFLERSVLALGGLGLLTVLVGGAAVYAISRRVARDIGSAAAAAEALAQGTALEPSDSIVTEVRSLIGSMRHSAALLKARERERDEHLQTAEKARLDAENADRAKDEFLAMLGHEMRNPLAPVLTALQLMRMRGETGSTRERDVIERQVKHLARLVDDLLDVSRLRRGKIELRRQLFELSTAVARAIEIAQPLIAERGHRLSIDVPAKGLVIDGDEMRIAQVVSNLLTNAAKYAEGAVRIELRARALDGSVVIECEDEGVGIPPDLMPRIFDLFSQGERTLDRRQGGLGLGLAVARTLTELHGGSITVASAGPGRGSRFTVSLPLVTADVRGVTPTAEPRRVLPHGRRVLVVDDNRDAVDMLVSALELSGFTVAAAGSGDEALSVFEKFHPDAAILDIGLPGMSGFELARRLRASTAGTRLSLIALTGYGQEKDIVAAYSAGFDVHLVKPVATEKLVEALAATLPTAV